MVGISELVCGCPSRRLEVRVVRKWVPNFRTHEIWFLVVYNKGDVIHVLAEKTNQAFGESKLQLSRCYSLQNYTCSNTETYRRMLQKAVHINVGRASKN